LVVVVLCAVYAENYRAPSHGKRLWPDIPPAGATILGIILLNAGVMLAWRIPPAWRTLNKYFIAVPGYPFAVSMLGQVFSHQQFGHFFLNMAMLWLVGTRRMITRYHPSFLSETLLIQFTYLLEPSNPLASEDI
jgi:rhomboid-like protein